MEQKVQTSRPQTSVIGRWKEYTNKPILPSSRSQCPVSHHLQLGSRIIDANGLGRFLRIKTDIHKTLISESRYRAPMHLAFTPGLAYFINTVLEKFNNTFHGSLVSWMGPYSAECAISLCNFLLFPQVFSTDSNQRSFCKQWNQIFQNKRSQLLLFQRCIIYCTIECNIYTLFNSVNNSLKKPE